MSGLTEAQVRHNLEFLRPVIDDNFRRQPSAAFAFAQMTAQLDDEVAANTARLVAFRRSETPLLLIWGKADPYLHVSIAEHLRSQARNATLHAVAAGHWPQIDAAAEVARIMLEGEIMSTATIFELYLGLSYLPWLLILTADVWQRLGMMDRALVYRDIAALRTSRVFGLVPRAPGTDAPQCRPAGATR